MHEFSVITSVLNAVRYEIDKRQRVRLVKEVHLDVGELTFLSHDALQFGFRAVAEREPRISPDGLRITSIGARVRCKSCGYDGPLEYIEKEEYHLRLPRFKCPECDGEIDIIQGQECVVRNLVLDVEDG
jgi:hydrogenase nickel incorporation protein HypA/HybF